MPVFPLDSSCKRNARAIEQASERDRASERERLSKRESDGAKRLDTYSGILSRDMFKTHRKTENKASQRAWLVPGVRCMFQDTKEDRK